MVNGPVMNDEVQNPRFVRPGPYFTSLLGKAEVNGTWTKLVET